MESTGLVIDTGIFVEYLRKPEKSKTILASLPNDTLLFVSAVTVYELITALIFQLPIKTLNKDHFQRIETLELA
ncbi:PIN domain-containing protein [Dyadobacter sp. BHUBP1]|uniref:PIN domain-containing protein n=1 Tax=Dyadobacter sp. BHUBP1 TaxID=3424178 RepID=UPI003D32D466